MNKIIALACLSIWVLPARSADVVKDVVAAAGPRVIDAARPAWTTLQTPSVPILDAAQGAALTAAPGLAADVEPVLPGATPAAGLIENGPQAAAAMIEPAAAKAEAPAIGTAIGLSAAAAQAREDGNVGRVEETSSRAFDKSEAAQAADETPVAARESSEQSRLEPASPAAKPQEAPPESSPAVFAGTWRKVSGEGYYDRVRVAATQDGVQVRYGGAFEYGYNLSGINAGPVTDKPWRGSFIAPGGLVTRETTTSFSDNKLVERSVRTETHHVRIPNQLVETRTLELRDGKLVETSESTLYRKAFFYFGPYTARTRINTTNLADPERPKTVTVYERVTAASNADSASGGGASRADDRPSRASGVSPSAPSLLARASGRVAMTLTALMAVASPALASTGSEPHAGAGAAALGAILGFIGAGLLGWARRDKSSGGDFDFTPLINGARVLIYGLAGAALAAVAATAISHPAGLILAFHPGAATLRAALGAAAGLAAGAFVGWEARSKSGGGDFDFTPLINGVKMLIFGLVGAVVGAVGAGLI